MHAKYLPAKGAYIHIYACLNFGIATLTIHVDVTIRPFRSSLHVELNLETINPSKKPSLVPSFPPFPSPPLRSPPLRHVFYINFCSYPAEKSSSFVPTQPRKAQVFLFLPGRKKLKFCSYPAEKSSRFFLHLPEVPLLLPGGRAVG